MPPPAEVLRDALIRLIAGFEALRASVARDLGVRDDYGEASCDGDDDDAGDSELLGEDRDELERTMVAVLVTETRAAIEAAMDAEDYAAHEVAAVVATLSTALEEIDPDVFADELGCEDAAAGGMDGDTDDGDTDDDDTDDGDTDDGADSDDAFGGPHSHRD